MHKDKSLDRADLVQLDALHGRQRDRFQPELALSVRRPHVDVWRLGSFIGVEMKPEKPDSQHGRHERKNRDASNALKRPCLAERARSLALASVERACSTGVPIRAPANQNAQS